MSSLVDMRIRDTKAAAIMVETAMVKMLQPEFVSETSGLCGAFADFCDEQIDDSNQKWIARRIFNSSMSNWTSRSGSPLYPVPAPAGWEVPMRFGGRPEDNQQLIAARAAYYTLPRWSAQLTEGAPEEQREYVRSRRILVNHVRWVAADIHYRLPADFVEHRQKLYEALVKFRNTEPKDRPNNEGLCSILANRMGFNSKLIAALMWSWPKFSGNYSYTVPGANGYGPHDAFYNLHHWEGDYGALRCELLDWMIGHCMTHDYAEAVLKRFLRKVG